MVKKSRLNYVFCFPLCGPQLPLSSAVFTKCSGLFKSSQCSSTFRKYHCKPPMQCLLTPSASRAALLASCCRDSTQRQHGGGRLTSAASWLQFFKSKLWLVFQDVVVLFFFFFFLPFMFLTKSLICVSTFHLKMKWHISLFRFLMDYLHADFQFVLNVMLQGCL